MPDDKISELFNKSTLIFVKECNLLTFRNFNLQVFNLLVSEISFIYSGLLKKTPRMNTENLAGLF